MKAKDTVMMPEQTRKKRKELFPHGHKDCFECEQFVRNAQAEISFKGGQQKEYKRWIKACMKAGMLIYAPDHLVNLHKAGIKQVVEWIEDNRMFNRKTDKWCEWQAQLKDWGL